MKKLLLFTLATVISLCAPCAALAADSVSLIASGVNFDPQIDHAVSPKLEFHDETNKTVALGGYFRGQPVVLVFTYYGCSNLCPTMISNLVERLDAAAISDSFRPEVIVLSVNPDDSASLAAQKKLAYLGARDVAADQWHFLIGAPSSISQLAHEVGLRYVYDGASHQYAHPAGIVLLTPQGRISSYLFGFDFTSAQLARELSDAAARRTSSRLERVLLVCFHYGPLTGAHSATILAALQALSAATLLAMSIFGVIRLTRKHRRGATTS